MCDGTASVFRCSDLLICAAALLYHVLSTVTTWLEKILQTPNKDTYKFETRKSSSEAHLCHITKDFQLNVQIKCFQELIVSIHKKMYKDKFILFLFIDFQVLVMTIPTLLAYLADVFAHDCVLENFAIYPWKNLPPENPYVMISMCHALPS